MKRPALILLTFCLIAGACDKPSRKTPSRETQPSPAVVQTSPQWFIVDGRDPALDRGTTYSGSIRSTRSLSPTDTSKRATLDYGCVSRDQHLFILLPDDYDTEDSDIAVQIGTGPLKKQQLWLAVPRAHMLSPISAYDADAVVRTWSKGDSVGIQYTPTGRTRRTVWFSLKGGTAVVDSARIVCGLK